MSPTAVAADLRMLVILLGLSFGHVVGMSVLAVVVSL